jgi:hypothetical protein
MPTLTVSNRTRTTLSLPATPPVVLSSRQNQAVSLADVQIAPGGSIAVKVNISELDAVQGALTDLQARGIIYVAVSEDPTSLLAAGVYSQGGGVGPQGAAGADGLQGAVGTQGNQGRQGLQGYQG